MTLLLSKPKRGMDAAQLSFNCDIVSHLKAFFFGNFHSVLCTAGIVRCTALLNSAAPKVLPSVYRHNQDT